MTLFTQDLPPDINSTEEESLNLIAVHGYEPDTFDYAWTMMVDPKDDEEYSKENTTLEPLPDYNPSFEDIKFNPSSQQWEISIRVGFLDEKKQSVFHILDKEFAVALRKISTPIAQSSGLYELKYKESVQYIGDGAPTDLSNYPLIEIGVSTSGMTAADYANLTISKHEEYNNKLVDIEKIRLKAKADINAIESDSGTDVEVLFSKIEEIAEVAIGTIIKLYG